MEPTLLHLLSTYYSIIIISHLKELYKKIANVIVVTLSKNIKWEDPITKRKLKYDTHYVLKKSKYPQLAFDSTVQCEDIRVVSKARLGQYICSVNLATDMKQIKKRLKSALQL